MDWDSFLRKKTRILKGMLKPETRKNCSLFALNWERKGDGFNRTFGCTKAAFFTNIIFNMRLFILKEDCLWWAYLQTVSASCALFFIDNGYHQITIPKQ